MLGWPVSSAAALQAQERQRQKLEMQKQRAQAEMDMQSERQKLEEAALPLMLDAMWAANVMDIQQTLKIVCHEVKVLPFVATAFTSIHYRPKASYSISTFLLRDVNSVT